MKRETVGNRWKTMGLKGRTQEYIGRTAQIRKEGHEEARRAMRVTEKSEATSNEAAFCFAGRQMPESWPNVKHVKRASDAKSQRMRNVDELFAYKQIKKHYEHLYFLRLNGRMLLADRSSL